MKMSAAHALQHRGQEGCGMLTMEKIIILKRQGLVGDHFTKTDIIKVKILLSDINYRGKHPGRLPFCIFMVEVSVSQRKFNERSLRNSLVKMEQFWNNKDTETIVQLIAKSKRNKMVEKIIDALFKFKEVIL